MTKNTENLAHPGAFIREHVIPTVRSSTNLSHVQMFEARLQSSTYGIENNIVR